MSDERDTDRPASPVTLAPPAALPITEPPPPAASPELELVLAELKRFNANLTLVSNVVREHGEVLARVEREVVGVRHASESGIDMGAEAKRQARTLRAICEAADEKASIAMDVATRIAEHFGVADIVQQVQEEHAEAIAEDRRTSVGPDR